MKYTKNEKNCTVKKEFGIISKKGTIEKKLTYTAWNGNEPNFDLRTWQIKPDGTPSPKKGYTMNRNELIELDKLIQVALADSDIEKDYNARQKR